MTLDLGAGRAERVLSGTARFASGTPVRPPSVIVLCGKPHATPVLHLSVDEAGRFSQRVPTGDYGVNLYPKAQMGPALGAPWSAELVVGVGGVGPLVHARADGTYLFEGVPAGRWTLVPVPPKEVRGTGVPLTVTVPASRDVPGLELEIRAE